jgi:protein-ribulosamine 3-kinase
MQESIFRTALQQQMGKLINPSIIIEEFSSVGEGLINTSSIVKTNHGHYFVKYNKDGDPQLFEKEVSNLGLLAQARAVKTPEVIGAFTIENMPVLLLEYIEEGTPHFDFWRDFGTGLARLHKNSAPQFGLDYNNYIGILPQLNTKYDLWIDFFIQCRLEPMLKRALDTNKADHTLVQKFESLYGKLNEIFPEEKPALLHGDLWGGNCMADMNGDPVMYDPASYYGHREMDLAMSNLFGGFDAEFYDAYNEEFPLEKNWKQRIPICNLYPLLVHANLFVGSYMQSIKNILNRF